MLWIKCDLIKVDEPTLNNMVYPKEVLEEAIKDYNKKSDDIKLGEIYNTIYINEDPMTIKLINVSHKINKLELNEEGYIQADIKVLDTFCGKILKKLIVDYDVIPFPCFTVKYSGFTVTKIYNTVVHMYIRFTTLLQEGNKITK